MVPKQSSQRAQPALAASASADASVDATTSVGLERKGSFADDAAPGKPAKTDPPRATVDASAERAEALRSPPAVAPATGGGDRTKKSADASADKANKLASDSASPPLRAASASSTPAPDPTIGANAAAKRPGATSAGGEATPAIAPSESETPPKTSSSREAPAPLGGDDQAPPRATASPASVGSSDVNGAKTTARPPVGESAASIEAAPQNVGDERSDTARDIPYRQEPATSGRDPLARLYAVPATAAATSGQTAAAAFELQADGIEAAAPRALESPSSRIGAETVLCSACHAYREGLNDLPHAAPQVAMNWRLAP
ncbi:MAG: hypothetical protein AAFU55_17110, partial [Pseudomonadota bacterium]